MAMTEKCRTQHPPRRSLSLIIVPEREKKGGEVASVIVVIESDHVTVDLSDHYARPSNLDHRGRSLAPNESIEVSGITAI